MVHASQYSIAENIHAIQARITAAENKYQRQLGSVQLLNVSKTRPIEDIQAAIAANQHCFGENYLQDALPKITALNEAGIEWHFIGPIQSNKTLQIAQHFDWVHSIDRLKIARRLSDQRSSTQSPLNICLQINSSGENSKSGVSPEEALIIAHEINALPRLTLRGLMTIPASCDDFEEQRLPFRLLRELKDELNSQGLQLDTLSMGMTNDMEAAIAEGSTMVRIGTAIFGARN
ncbi:MAG: YggS family pyridoxal phosphate-dependent enzyme [Gammaproteobacteria bacterium]|nr:YggS family pyridoxal phosphate-dependent enzyme [Gammaproteobacteria bacterium]